MTWLNSLGMLSLVLCGTVSLHAQDATDVERQLTTTGLVVEIHGASPGLSLFAVTYRSPTNFFEFVQLSLVARDAAVESQLRTMQRHDRVRIKGSLLPNPSPQMHILASSIELVANYVPAIAAPPYEYSQTARDLDGKSSGRFLVHIARPDDGILVVEYKDAVLPIFVLNKQLLTGLARNDVVQLRFRQQDHPDRPTHLRLDEAHREPLRVVDRITSKHGKRADMKGALVLFPKSPQIVSNVFAILEELPGGLTRQYTLVNLASERRFAEIRTKLQAAWDRHAAPGDYVNGRNKLVSLKVRVRARGIFNQTDSGQANPQILLESADSISLEEVR